MAQNIYDDAEFFNAYSRLERSRDGLDGAVEWPALRALLPELHDLNILDLGCGFGWFCRWARQNGAAHVLGIDVSERMLAHAKAATQDGAITYAQADLEHLELPAEAFHLVYSSLVFHYIENLKGLLSQVARALVPGGHLIFSVEHPIYTAPAAPDWSVEVGGRKSWLLDGYLDEGPRSTDWLASGVIKQHRTLATYINLLFGLDLCLVYLEEWGPSETQIAARPARIEDRQRPPFLLMVARCMSHVEK